MRAGAAGLLGLLLPGAGHWLIGRRRTAVIFLAPVVALVAAVAILLVTQGIYGLVAVLVTPGVLPALAVLNVILAAWRIAAGVDAARRGTWTRQAGAVLAAGIVVLVVVPHLVAGRYVTSLDEFLDTTFPGEPSPSPQPTTVAVVTDPPPTPEPTPTPTPEPPSPTPTPTPTPAPSPSPAPTTGPGGGGSSGTGTLPALGASTPWTPPGEVPWGTDGRFTLLLLGSDAGPDRWSRRMDSMILVEIDVATGKVAMVGLPRNMTNAPYPPGPARNAVSCGCLSGLLNEMYVEATDRNPSRWPGTGAIKGIGAVRAVISELTAKPIDAVLVADMWGMVKVVDAMGGIEVNVPARVREPAYPDLVKGPIPLDIPAGIQRFDGHKALAYARTRHQDSDYSRMARQQVILLAIRDQLLPATILNGPALFDAAKGFTWTDLPRSSLPKLVELFGRASTAQVKQLRLIPPTYPGKLTSSGLAKIRADIKALLGSAPAPTPTPAPTPAPTPTPSPSPAPTPSPASTAAPTPTLEPSPSPAATTPP